MRSFVITRLCLVVVCSGVLRAEATGESFAALVLEGARKEAAQKTRYVEESPDIRYPGGDVPADTGVCTDLVVRAFRTAGVDLQKELHEDRVAHPEFYPWKIWDRKKADANIDHRRCPNLEAWFKRHAKTLSIAIDPEATKSNWRGSDVVFFVRAGASYPWHVAIVSDRKAADGMALIIDGFPPFTSETHRLDTFGPIGSHFRYEGKN